MRNSWPTSTSTCSIGVPERRSSQYSFTNSAESCVPASICMACESLEGAGTFSEEWVVGLYQYIFVSSFPKNAVSDVPDATSAKTLAEVLRIPFLPLLTRVRGETV